MDTRRKPEKSSLEQIGSRVRQRALSGSEASAVGFTLVVYIFAGAGLGYLLDRNLETSYWIAIGMLIGTAIGFREMFRLTKKLTRQSALDDDGDFPMKKKSSSTNVASQNTPTAEESAPAEATRNRPRIFSVPPPPQASYEQRRATPSPTPEPAESQEAFMERLLDDGTTEDESDEVSDGDDAQQIK